MKKRINELRLWKDNPRGIKNDKFEELKNRIKRWGVYKPLVITPDGEVLGGNMRLRACQELGILEVPVTIVNPETEAEKVELAITDNQEMGFYQDQEVAELIDKYKDEIDLTKYGYKQGEGKTLQEILDQFSPVEEDEVPELEEGEPESKLGEVYQLGRHRLMTGDATKKEDVEKLMCGERADMVFTDPPYGISVVQTSGQLSRKGMIGGDNRGKATPYRPVIGDDKPFDPEPYLGLAHIVLMFGGQCYASKLPDNPHWIVWDKHDQMTGLDRTFFSDAELIWTNIKDKKGVTMYRHLWKGYNQEDMKNKEERVHPTQKPLKLLADILKDYSKPDQIILDLFGGSGSTLIACEQTNRICYMMELDEKYCDVIRKRYAKFIGKGEEWQKITPIIR